MTTIIEQISRAKPHENPVYKIACQVVEMQERGASWEEVRALSDQVDQAFAAGRNEERNMANAMDVLSNAEAEALKTVPIGF